MDKVTPYAGVWIEIHTHICLYQWGLVTPYAGVWIEITKEFVSVADIPVTPYAGVWIEITVTTAVFCRIWSLPTRECGLK